MASGNFGERLKRERELREVSLKEVTVATRIGSRFLEALENEDWSKLPGGVFNRGFVRAIARYLGLDEEDLLAEYDLARGEQPVEAPPDPANRIPAPPKWIFAVAVLAVLIAVAGLVAAGIWGWRRYSAHHRERQAAAVSAQASSSADRIHGASPLTPSSLPLDLAVSTSATTRVRILADGKPALDSELPAGETRHFSATHEFEVTAADSSAVLLQLNGQAMPPLGSSGASGRIVLSQKDLRQAPGGNSQP
jgi:cytoskeleton protein RodZ